MLKTTSPAPASTPARRPKVASFLEGEEPLLQSVETDAFVEAVNDLPDGQLGHLANSLPVYLALVNDAGSVVVTGAAVVA